MGSWVLSREIVLGLFCRVVKEQQILTYCYLNSKVWLLLRCSLAPTYQPLVAGCDCWCCPGKGCTRSLCSRFVNALPALFTGRLAGAILSGKFWRFLKHLQVPRVELFFFTSVWAAWLRLLRCPHPCFLSRLMWTLNEACLLCRGPLHLRLA